MLARTRKRFARPRPRCLYMISGPSRLHFFSYLVRLCMNSGLSRLHFFSYLVLPPCPLLRAPFTPFGVKFYGWFVNFTCDVKMLYICKRITCESFTYANVLYVKHCHFHTSSNVNLIASNGSYSFMIFPQILKYP